MSFFKSIRKILLIEILNETHKFYALQSSNLITFGKLQREIETNLSQESLEQLAQILIDHLVSETKPSIKEMLELDVATLRNISQEIVLASTPLEYVNESR